MDTDVTLQNVMNAKCKNNPYRSFNSYSFRITELDAELN